MHVTLHQCLYYIPAHTEADKDSIDDNLASYSPVHSTAVHQYSSTSVHSSTAVTTNSTGRSTDVVWMDYNSLESVAPPCNNWEL